MATTSATVSAGTAVTNIQSAANGTNQPRSLASWLPAPRVDIVTPDVDQRTGKVTGYKCAPEWYRFFHEMTLRLGGIQGANLSTISSDLATVQNQANTATTTISGVVTSLNSAVDAVNTTIQVAQNNALTGADGITRADRYNL